MVQSVDPIGYNSIPQHPIGLAKLAEMYLRRHLEKDRRIRSSNWESDMSHEQLTCEWSCLLSIAVSDSSPTGLLDAANDAACSLRVFLELGLRLTPVEYESATPEFEVVEGFEVNFSL